MRRFVKGTILLGALAGAAYAAWRVVKPPASQPGTWEPQPFPFPPVPRPMPAPRPEPPVHVPEVVEPGGGPELGAVHMTGLEPWIEPLEGTCPLSHPVKAKLASGIFHVPGGMNYERTKPDRCYLDPAAAETDGLRPAKR